MMTNTGAASFIAPEVAKSEHYNENIDIWGVGCVLFVMLTNKKPFPQKK
jgi:serine/threonine protein kinase